MLSNIPLKIKGRSTSTPKFWNPNIHKYDVKQLNFARWPNRVKYTRSTTLPTRATGLKNLTKLTWTQKIKYFFVLKLNYVCIFQVSFMP